MRISIITPSYNQVKFIERTILSVLNQNISDLEYIIVDGGSTDGSLDIIKKYESRLKWISEKDNGQSEAINKGLKMATGEIVAFLNSDDTYSPNCLENVIHFFKNNPDKKWAYGKCRIINEEDKEIRVLITMYKNMLLHQFSYNKLLTENFISQPATFWKRELHNKIGFLSELEHYCMDYEFWLRIGQFYPAGVIHEYLANFRFYANSKSGKVNKKQFQDELRLAIQYANGKKIPILLHRINYFKIVLIYRIMSFFKI